MTEPETPRQDEQELGNLSSPSGEGTQHPSLQIAETGESAGEADKGAQVDVSSQAQQRIEDALEKTTLDEAAKYSWAEWIDINPYGNVVGYLLDIVSEQAKKQYNLRERILVLVLFWATDYCASVVAAVLVALNAEPMACEELLLDGAPSGYVTCDEMKTDPFVENFVQILVTVFYAFLFNFFLGGALVRQAFQVKCRCNFILYLWTLLILSVAIVLILIVQDLKCTEEISNGYTVCIYCPCGIDQCNVNGQFADDSTIPWNATLNDTLSNSTMLPVECSFETRGAPWSAGMAWAIKQVLGFLRGPLIMVPVVWFRMRPKPCAACCCWSCIEMDPKKPYVPIAEPACCACLGRFACLCVAE